MKEQNQKNNINKLTIHVHIPYKHEGSPFSHIDDSS